VLSGPSLQICHIWSIACWWHFVWLACKVYMPIKISNWFGIQQYMYIATIKQASRLPHVSAKPLHINYDIRQLQNYMHQYWCLQIASMLKISHWLNNDILIVVRHLWFYLWILLLKALVFCKLKCRVVCCQGHLYKSVTFDLLHVDDILYGWLVKLAHWNNGPLADMSLHSVILIASHPVFALTP
jgi:hypothetical protein